jgi:hypothetical protein
MLFAIFTQQDGICEDDFYDPRMLSAHVRAGYTAMNNFDLPSELGLIPDDTQVALWQAKPKPRSAHSANAAIRAHDVEVCTVDSTVMQCTEVMCIVV